MTVLRCRVRRPGGVRTGPTIDPMQQPSLFLPCAQGVESWLGAEVRQLAGSSAQVDEARGGVAVSAASADALKTLAMRANLESRLAQRVLWQVATAPYRSEDDLYALGRTVRWAEWITPRETLRVDVTAQRSPLKSLTADHASLYVDTSGEALFKRGWREDKGEAPLKETLAAAMLAAADWQGRAEDGPLLDPVCGAGTIAIEAAQIACGIAPGLSRRFAFEKLAPFRGSQREWQQLREAARARVHAPAAPVFAGDVSFRMTDFASRNAQRAGVDHAIQFKTADALQRPAPAERGTLMLNPPYGERIEPKGSRGGRSAPVAAAREGFEGGAEAAEFFARLASHWKRAYAGWTAYVLSPDMKLPQAMRLKESRRTVMWNGPIECRLFRFDLVAGSMRADK